MAQYYSGLNVTYGNEIKHHGIPGQKWGEKNGPPYPLSRLQKSSSERRETTGSKTKEELIRRGSAREVMSRRDEFTDQEIKQIVNRIDTERRLKTLADSEQKSTFSDIIDKFMQRLNRINNWTDTSLKTYKNIQQIMEILDGKSGKKK